MKNSLQRLVKLVAAKDNPHDLINEVAADAELLNVTRQIYQKKASAEEALSKDLWEFCRMQRIPVEYFYDRLELVARILNLEGHQQDYYRILGIKRDSAQQEIKHAFRRLSLANHPDTNPGDSKAVERLRNILQAYEILGNDTLRKHYDKSLESLEWVEYPPEDPQENPVAGMKRWSYLWPAVALLAVLLLVVFLVDYQSLMTDKYYHSSIKVRKEQAKRVASDLETASLQHPMPDASTYVGNTQIPQGYSAVPGNQTRDGGLISNTKSTVEESQMLARLETVAPKSSDTAPSDLQPVKPKKSGAHAKKAATSSATIAPEKDPKSESRPAEEKTVQPSSGKHEKEENQENRSTPESPEKAAEKPASNIVVATSEKNTPIRKDQERPSALSAQKKGGNAAEKSNPLNVSEASAPKSHDSKAVKARSEQTVQDLGKRVESFLRRYTQAYQKRDLNLFLGFFDADAAENGQPVKSLASTYLKTFLSTEQIRFQIQLQQCSQTNNGVSAKGRFHLLVKSHSKVPVESSGSIRLQLVDLGNDFKVKNLDYSFANQEL